MRSQDTEEPGAVRLRTRILSVLGLVAVGALAAYLLIGDGQPTSSSPRGEAATPSSSSSAEDVEELSVETITESQPTGQWRAQLVGRSSLLRSGERVKLDYRQQPTIWTFTSRSCDARGCTGTVSSSSGRDFTYVWDGRELVVDRHLLTDESGKLACLDGKGESLPSSSAAAIQTYRYSFGSFAGTADRMTSRVVIEIATEFIGSCREAPDDPLTYVEDQVLTRIPAI